MNHLNDIWSDVLSYYWCCCCFGCPFPISSCRVCTCSVCVPVIAMDLLCSASETTTAFLPSYSVVVDLWPNVASRFSLICCLLCAGFPSSFIRSWISPRGYWRSPFLSRKAQTLWNVDRFSAPFGRPLTFSLMTMPESYFPQHWLWYFASAATRSVSLVARARTLGVFLLFSPYASLFTTE